MLTHVDILQVAEWKDRVGERRPGFLYDCARSLLGPSCANYPIPASAHPENAEETVSINVLTYKVTIEPDPQTGELRLVRR
jgi:hypothetical protein